MQRNILIRIQSPVGTKRIEAQSNEKTATVFEKIRDEFALNSFNFRLFKDRNKKNGEINSTRSKTLASYNINHGDMLYMELLDGMFAAGPSYEDEDRNSVETPTVSSSIAEIVEDDVDIQLHKVDGKIERCRHGTNTKCVHCSALEPYDAKHLEEQNIKHLSFHSHLRKLRGGVDKGKFVALENISCRIKPGCNGHSPWPKGICSNCQPNAITLNRQVYRHLDNVMFENPQLVELFLNYWRSTGHQRLGFLYGRYETHKDVPLGIKATVAAIYEPPQESTRDNVMLLPDDRAEAVDAIAAHIGLHKVGWIFTDLVVDDVVKGTVKHFRNVNSHFLSAQECIMAGHFQNQHPNPCRHSATGYFGSKFVTVCVTGDSQNQVHMEGYQVSNQCMALVRDDCLVPTKDAPELGYIRESTNDQYVPDVFFKEKDEYGNEVTQLARPLPIEYLLIDVPVSTPLEPLFTFYVSQNVKPFPVENRIVDGHLQDFSSLVTYLQQFPPDSFLDIASDFHFLIYISTMDMLPMRDCIGPLLEAVKVKDRSLAETWSKSEQWATVEQMMAAQGMSSSVEEPIRSSPSSSTTTALWTCQHCTYLNQPDGNLCEICGLPR